MTLAFIPAIAALAMSPLRDAVHNGARSVSLHLIDEDGGDRGSLGEARIAPTTRSK
jgi:hypothetical protein